MNLYLRVFSFNLNNLGFWILLRFISPNSPFSGLWSVTTMRLEQPMTNIRHFYNAHTIAGASPSIGAYLLSASIQNLLPANIRCHPSGQQTVAHEQYFVTEGSPFLLWSCLERGRWCDSSQTWQCHSGLGQLWPVWNIGMQLRDPGPTQNVNLV